MPGREWDTCDHLERARLSDDQLRSHLKSLLWYELKGLYHFRHFLPGVAFILTAYVVSTYRTAGSVDFYKSAASVIPTLLLTLAVQGRFFRLSTIPTSPIYEVIRRNITTADLRRLGIPSALAWLSLHAARIFLPQVVLQRWFTAVQLLLAIAIGEGSALYVVESGTPSNEILAFVSGAITAAFVGIILVALLGVEAEDTAQVDEVEKEKALGVVAGLIARRNETS
jgi:hypothetical protein